ncbi:unnamed protein product, partial [Brenthis ino]
MQPSVTEFYEGKSIFITGATGFVGKAIVEKLLRSCPGIKTIYVLMRQKKGISSEQRLKELCNNSVFDVLRDTQPEVFNKLKLLAGDIFEPELGLSNDDRHELQRHCNIVFHSAACVRFDQELKFAVQINTIGTLKVLELAETMPKLEAFVHLSTAYCRCHLEVFEEKMYPAIHQPRKIIDLVEWMDDETLRHLEPKLISSEPNTYSYTKAITEDLVAEYSSKYPIAIGRPSIVTAAWKEPAPGWVDNLNAATGFIVGCGKGVLHTMNCKPTYTADMVPVDVVVNGCILIAYVTALEKSKDVRIYNITLSGAKSISWNEISSVGQKWLREYPYSVSLWYSRAIITSNWLLHQIMFLLTQLIPAYFIDMLLFLMGRKTFVIEVQKRISHGTGILLYYTNKEWHFINKNFVSLKNKISKYDNEIFFTNLEDVNVDLYIKDYVLGTRKYIVKEDISTLPRARKLLKM